MYIKNVTKKTSLLEPKRVPTAIGNGWPSGRGGDPGGFDFIENLT